MWVWLNEEGKRMWGGVFPDGKVPVCSNFQEASLEGGGTERVVFVNWAVLTKRRKKAVLARISVQSGASEDDILKDILKIGLPLRERYTTHTVAAELRFFI
jgi:hypothetical protein